MSQMVNAEAIINALMQDCIDAWTLGDGRVDFGQKRFPQNVVPYAIIDMLPVAMGALGARTVKQDYTFRIYARFEFPATGNILLAKIAKANLLIAKIITGANYRDLAYLPYITEFDPTEEDEPQQRVYEFSVTFTCQASESHHG